MNEPIDKAPLPVMAYETRPASNRAAVLSVAFGAAIIIPLIGILAIYFGRRALQAAREQAAGRVGMARTGIVLGVINLVLTAGALIVLPPAAANARRAALQTHCLVNLRQLGAGVMIYAAANRGLLPATLDDLATVLPATSKVYACAACAGDPRKKPATVGAVVTSNYVLIQPAPRLAQVKRTSETVIVYEPLGNHDGRGIGLLFCDGHAEVLPPALATKVLAELAAGQNPPPALGP